LYLAAGAKYVLGAGTSLAAFNPAIGTALESSKVLCFYQYAPDATLTNNMDRLGTVFVKYVDANSANRFAFFVVISSIVHELYTTVDVSTMTDPAEYTSAWTYALNGTDQLDGYTIDFA
jgi:hypothetical protein